MGLDPSPKAEEAEPMELDQRPWYADLWKQMKALWYGLAGRSLKIGLQGTLEILSRWIRGAPISHYSQITPEITVSGQYRKSGWDILAKRGITAVVNMRAEWDDQAAGIAPENYLHLKVVDNTPPSLEMLQEGVDFIRQEVANGGKVYIHCAAGVGRAPTMAAAYLISKGMTPDEALEQIRNVRPFIRPTTEQIAQLRAYSEKMKAEQA